ncbi:Uncharacterized domain DM10 and Protein of unknown function DUF1126 repeat-containing protein [Aphelenchoides bicaudatus]|nr:Uncharacterized domain DM10 and Protein of unknown function DUF1126 repeat-containing protein [Aphelenchoides bicaudatus]
MNNKYDSPRSFNDACTCFSDDTTFFTHSFTRAKPKPQVLTKIGDESFFKLSKKVPPAFEPRISAAPEFYDPLHKANLCFYIYLNESDGEGGELLKIRPMKLTYHLDDDTISLYEPHSTNSGHIQGRQFSRQRVPRNDRRVGEDFLTYRDFKIGKDLKMFGRNYRIVACDDFTRNFLADRGVEVGAEQTPLDAWNVFKHFRPQQIYREVESPSRFFNEKESDMKSWENEPQILMFLAAWLDSKNDFHNTKIKRTFRLAACPEDDTTELTPGFDYFGNALFLKSSRLPYLTSDRRHRYYHVSNFRPGIWINVFKRPMYIYDCENEATRNYIRQQFGNVSFGECPIEVLKKGPPTEQFEATTISTLPSELVLKAINHEFPVTKFIVFYYLNSQRVDIFEFIEAHPETKTFFKSIEPQSEVNHQMQMYDEGLDSL